ncbi:hypothetical protein DPMN_009797 [Dreissena polymorpha]|uniref:Zinc finger PHD-type domain-containing protein n=1 Tax=Dreissena polymorpha TaxID=45954 RepID=A0A9D4N1Y3_DREPO|nr:hypothetical protein DPMN_009797 [Dreissena polymorpha]
MSCEQSPSTDTGTVSRSIFPELCSGTSVGLWGQAHILCNALQCIDPRGQLKWLNCDVCGRWVHEKCIGTGLDTEGFRCDICNVQYS